MGGGDVAQGWDILMSMFVALVEKFVVPKAPRLINISSETRRDIIATYATVLSARREQQQSQGREEQAIVATPQNGKQGPGVFGVQSHQKLQQSTSTIPPGQQQPQHQMTTHRRELSNGAGDAVPRLQRTPLVEISSLVTGLEDVFDEVLGLFYQHILLPYFRTRAQGGAAGGGGGSKDASMDGSLSSLFGQPPRKRLGKLFSGGGLGTLEETSEAGVWCANFAAFTRSYLPRPTTRLGVCQLCSPRSIHIDLGPQQYVSFTTSYTAGARIDLANP